jgi:CRP/FNR family transcriptional regulator, polysaccharide utilization system transcription regulator
LHNPIKSKFGFLKIMSGNNSIESCRTCIVRWKNFDHLSDQELDLVNENRYEATFKPGEIIIKQGSPSSSALFISSGLAKNYIESPKGKNFIMSIIKPGRLIVGPGAYVNSRHTYTVAAITAVQACFVNFNVIRHLVKTNGVFAESLLEDISAKSLRTHLRIVNLTQKKMPGRLADALLYFADEVFSSSEFEMILSRQELGEMTNMAKENVVRILREMEESMLISSEESMIRILDREKLVQISEKG